MTEPTIPSPEPTEVGDAVAPAPLPAPSAAQPGWPSVPAEAVVIPTKTSTNAIVALILAIASWVFCPIVPAIIALVLAHLSDKEVAASGGLVTGAGLSLSAKIVAWVNIGVWAALVLLGVLIMFIALLAGGFDQVGRA